MGKHPIPEVGTKVVAIEDDGSIAPELKVAIRSGDAATPRCVNCGDEFEPGTPGSFIGATCGFCSEYCQRAGPLCHCGAPATWVQMLTGFLAVTASGGTSEDISPFLTSVRGFERGGCGRGRRGSLAIGRNRTSRLPAIRAVWVDTRTRRVRGTPSSTPARRRRGSTP